MKKRIVLFISFVSSFVVHVDISAVEFMLPRIAASLDANIHQAGYLITSYLIGITCFGVPAGYFADIYSRKRVYIAGLAAFGLASLALSLSTHISSTILFRLFQGISAGAITAVGFSYIVETFEEAERGKPFTYIAASIALGYLTGPSLGGWFVGVSGWYLIFAVNIPLMTTLVILALFYLPEIKRQIITRDGFSFRALDFIGLFAFVVGVCVIVLAIDQYDVLSSVQFLVLAGLLTLAFWFTYRSNQTNDYPVIDLYLLYEYKEFSLGCLLLFFSFVSAYIVAFIMPFYVLNVPTGLTITQLGYLLTFFPLGFLLGSVLGGQLLRSSGPLPALIVVNAFVPVTVMSLLFLDAASGIWKIGALGFVVGTGRGLFIAPFNTYIAQCIPTYRIASSGGFVSLVRNMGMIVGTTLAAAGISTFSVPVQMSHSTGTLNLVGKMEVFYILVSVSFLVALLSLACTIVLMAHRTRLQSGRRRQP